MTAATIDIATRGTSIHVTDIIEQRQCVLRTPTPASPESIDGEEFYFPVDAAVALDVESLTLGNYVSTYVRDEDGDVVADIDRFDEQTHEAGSYLVEIEQAVKLYVRVEGTLRVETGEMTTIETDGDLSIGARSRHNHPATTITTTGAPEELLDIVSVLSSSLKTMSPERTYPTLRGHPPEIEIGESLDIPPELSMPDSGIRIETPVQRQYIYPIAPLAFYFGAELVPGNVPRIVGEDGFTYRLDRQGGFEQTVERVLKQCLLFDCIARTEGLYGFELAERNELEQTVDLDWASLYDSSVSEQAQAYLSVPYEDIHEHVPEWKTTGYIAPTPENAELLPFLLNDLSTVRMPEGASVTASEAQANAMFDFVGSGEATTRSTGLGERSTSDEQPLTQLVEPEATDAFRTVWADEGMPIGETKASVPGYRNGLDHSPSQEIGVTVVINDEGMADEGDVAEEVYGDDTEFPFDLRVYRNLTTDRLKAVLETDRDFLHYVGHIEADGFQCTDGRLDARDLAFVGVDAFFLNGCASYDQGMALLERGAVGGVVTVTEVVDSGAARVGKAMVKLLNHGFPLDAALSVARDQSFVGGQYSVVGNGDVEVVQRDSLGAMLLEVERTGESFETAVVVYPTADFDVGSVTSMYLAEQPTRRLGPGRIEGPRYTDPDALLEVLQAGDGILRLDGEIRESSSLTQDDLV